MDNLSIVHFNIQSLYPKLDILEVEMQYYDIVVYTETWLIQNRKNEDIMTPNLMLHIGKIVKIGWVEA